MEVWSVWVDLDGIIFEGISIELVLDVSGKVVLGLGIGRTSYIGNVGYSPYKIGSFIGENPYIAYTALYGENAPII